MNLPKHLFQLMLMALLLPAGLVQAQNKVAISRLWKTDVNTFFENSPVLAHLNGNEESQVVVAGREDLVALDSNGKVLWTYRSKGRYMMSPSILESKNKPTLIYATDVLGNLRCHDSQGKVLWESKLSSGTSWSAPSVADLEGTGIYSIVQADESGSVFAFDALTGKPLWKSSIKGKPSSAALGDLDGKPGLEIAYLSTDGILSVLHPDGSPYWDRSIGGSCQTWGNAAPVIFVSSDGLARIFTASADGEAFCFSATGTKLWTRQVKGAVASTLSAGDIDQNGVADLFLITQLGVIYRFAENGELLWNIDMQGRTLGSGSIIDLNGDGAMEYIFCTQDGHLQALDLNGKPVFDFNFGHRTINITPTFGEITKKSSGLEMTVTGGESGLVYCFKTTAPVNATKHWITSCGSITKINFWTGLTSKTQLSMVPAHLNWNELYVGEDVSFDVFNPEKTEELILIEASCTHPDGKYQSVTSKLAGQHSKIFLPFHGMSPGVYKFTWGLSTTSGKILLSGEHSVNLTPFLNEKSLIQASLNRLNELGERMAAQRPDLSEALSLEAASIERHYKLIKPMQELALAGNQPEQGDITEKSLFLTLKAKKAIQVAELAEASLALPENTTILPFEGKLWENGAREDALPLQAENSISLNHTMVAGENEPVSLNLFNMLGRNVTVRIVADTLPKGLKIDFQHSVPSIDALGKPAWDALPDLDESRTVSIPSLSTKEIWINISCTADMKPGHYRIPVLVKALNGANVQNGPRSPQNVALPSVRAVIDLEVLNFGMAPKGTMRLCAWGAYDAVNIRNLLDHENTVFIVPNGKSASGGSGFDFTAMDKVVNELKGNDVFLLLNHIPDVIKENEFGSPSPKLDLYLEKLTEHLASKGIDKKHFAFYPYDEPGGIGWTVVDKLVAFSKLVKSKDPELMIYMDGGGETPMFKAMQPYMDVWTVAYNVLPEKSPAMDVVRNDQGSLLWTYDCSYSYARPMGPNIKNINLVGQFRLSALVAFRWNATGIGYWCYNLGDDMWGRNTLEYPLVYNGVTKPVNSRRWEAVREGVEDYRILFNLKAALNQPNSTLKPEMRTKIENLLKSMTSLVDQSDSEMKLGLSRKVMDVTNSEEAILQLRKEMMDCVKSLSNQ